MSALAQSAELVATIRLKDEFTATGKKAEGEMKRLEKQTSSLRKSTERLQRAAGTTLKNSFKVAGVAAAFLAYNIKQGINELVEWEDAQLQVTAAIKSTNGAAHVSSQMVEDLAKKYAELVMAEDDVILSAESIILRYPNVTKKAFEPALKAALDLAAATGKDVTSAARDMARSLNDPVAGLSRLTRQGVTFTEGEKKKIAALVESGKRFRAQTIILDKVNQQFGGTAQKASEGYRGSMVRLNKAIKNLQQALAAPLIKPLERIARALGDFANKPEIAQGLTDFGNALASFVTDENLTKATDALSEGFQFVKNLDWKAIGTGFQTTADIASKSVALFKSLPPGVQSALVTLLAANKLTGGLVGDVFKGLGGLVLNNLKTITAANVTVIGTNVTNRPDAATTPSVAAAVTAVIPVIAWDLFFRKPVEDAVQGALGKRGPLDLGGESLMGPGKTLSRRDVRRAFLGFDNPFFNSPTRQGGTFGGSTLAPSFPNSNALRDQFTTLANTLSRQGKLTDDHYVDLANSVANGTKTYRQAVKELRGIKGAQGEVKDAIKGIKYQFTLKPSVTISASATGNAITFAANGQRLEIR
jgi:hypothetical protein